MISRTWDEVGTLIRMSLLFRESAGNNNISNAVYLRGSSDSRQWGQFVFPGGPVSHCHELPVSLAQAPGGVPLPQVSIVGWELLLSGVLRYSVERFLLCMVS